jgi:hypothetical protein
MSKKLKEEDILLVKEKDSNELSAANMNKNGEVKMTKINEGENPDFLKIDKRANILENFYENFKRQVHEPTRFEFFRVPLERLNEIVQKLQDAFKSPDAPPQQGIFGLAPHRTGFFAAQAARGTSEGKRLRYPARSCEVGTV